VEDETEALNETLDPQLEKIALHLSRGVQSIITQSSLLSVKPDQLKDKMRKIQFDCSFKFTVQKLATWVTQAQKDPELKV